MKIINKKIVLLLVGLIVALCMISCANSKLSSSNNTISEGHTLLIYMSGSTLESRNGAATKNIEEILDCEIPADTNILIETGGTSKWRKYDISSDEVSRYEVKDNKLILIETIGNKSMGDSNTLSDFLSWGCDKYKSSNVGVILWNHGGGSSKGVCFDEKFDMDGLTLSELQEAFTTADKEFEYVGFDACLMANYETVNIVSPYAKYMVASEEVEPSGGWDYSAVVKFGENNYYDNLLSSYQKKCESNNKSLYTLTYIDLGLFSSVEENFTKLSTTLQNEGKDNLGKIVSCADASMNFGANSSNESYSNLIDLHNFAENMKQTELVKSIEESVHCVNSMTRNSAKGLSFYYPLNNIKEVNEIIKEPINEDYRTFLADNYVGLDTEKEYITFINSGEDRNGELYFEVSPESKRYIKNISYQIYQFDVQNEYEQEINNLGIDSDVVTVGKNGYVTSFEGVWVQACNQLLPVEIIDHVDNITTFATHVKRNGSEGSLRYSFDITDKSFVLQGFMEKETNDTMSRIQSLEDGDKLTVMVDQYDSNYEYNTVEKDTLTYDQNFKLKVSRLEDGYYQFHGIVTDIYGREYKTNSIVSEYSNGVLKGIAVSDSVTEM